MVMKVWTMVSFVLHALSAAMMLIVRRLGSLVDDVEEYADYDSDFEPKADAGHHDVDPYAGTFLPFQDLYIKTHCFFIRHLLLQGPPRGGY